MEFLDWEPEGKIGEAAGLVVGGRLLDMLVTPLEAGGVEADVIDGVDVIWRGVLPTIGTAKAEAVVQARRAGFRVV